MVRAAENREKTKKAGEGMDRIALRMMRCPKCGGKHIDGFERAYWFLCRDCGYNSPAYDDEARAIKAFVRGD